MIGNLYQAPKEVIESGWFVVVARDDCHNYNPSRAPWFLQVREYRDGKAVGPWIPVTYTEFKEWNPDATTERKQWVARGNSLGATQFC